MKNIYFVVPCDSELYHFGIKGQKWGVRRFQNEDMTWTAAGKKRYGDGGSGTTKSASKSSKNTKKSGSFDKEKAIKAAKIAAGVAVAAGATYVVAHEAKRISELKTWEYQRDRWKKQLEEELRNPEYEKYPDPNDYLHYVKGALERSEARVAYLKKPGHSPKNVEKYVQSRTQSDSSDSAERITLGILRDLKTVNSDYRDNMKALKDLKKQAKDPDELLELLENFKPKSSLER